MIWNKYISKRLKQVISFKLIRLVIKSRIKTAKRWNNWESSFFQIHGMKQGFKRKLFML